jgi:hypothetical protein
MQWQRNAVISQFRLPFFAASSISTICCSGEGLFNTTMTGPGKIWIQSLSIDKMRTLFPPNVQQQGSSAEGGGGGD